MTRQDEAVRAGQAAAAKVLRRGMWRHEAEDVRQDGVLGALQALASRPDAPFVYLYSAALNEILRARLRRNVDEEAADVAPLQALTVNPWPQVDAAITVAQLAVVLRPAEIRAVCSFEQPGRGAPAHYQARARGLRRMRACA